MSPGATTPEEPESLLEAGHLADPRRLLRSGDTALIVGPQAINVVRRGPNGRWRYAISLVETDHSLGRNGQ